VIPKEKIALDEASEAGNCVHRGRKILRCSTDGYCFWSVLRDLGQKRRGAQKSDQLPLGARFGKSRVAPPPVSHTPG
jgi:hypothetical protein